MSASDEEFDRFCAAAREPLIGALAHHCGDVAVASELAQEALIRAYLRWDRVRTLDSPIGWTFRVGANLSTSRFRRRQAERRAIARLGHPIAAAESPDGADAVAVRDALGVLTPKQRVVVIMRFFLDLSAEQAARTLGTRPDAIRALTHRAVSRLRQVLIESEGEVSHG